MLENAIIQKRIFIGVDIGKTENVVRFLDSNGKDLRKNLKFKNNYRGFINFREELDILVYDYKFTYGECLIGIESTGHYGINFHDFCNNIDISVVRVKAYVVKKTREIDAPQKGKNDVIDAKVIGTCLRDGRYNRIKKQTNECLSLRRITRNRETQIKNRTKIKNQIHAWLDVNNPVYIQVVKNINSKTGFALLRAYPRPQDVKDVSFNTCIAEVKKYTTSPTRRLVDEYIEECELYNSITKVSDGTMEVIEFEMYLKQLDFLDFTIKELDKIILELTEKVQPIFKELKLIKGISPILLASVIAEIGDINNYKTPRDLLSFVGLELRENSSGNVKSETNINKAGSRIIRKHLYILVMRLITSNDEFRWIYCYYKSYRRENENKKKEMLIATVCKFLRALYGMIKYNEVLNVDKLLDGLDIRSCNEVKFIEEFTGKNKKINSEDELWGIFDK